MISCSSSGVKRTVRKRPTSSFLRMAVSFRKIFFPWLLVSLILMVCTVFPVSKSTRMVPSSWPRRMISPSFPVRKDLPVEA